MPASAPAFCLEPDCLRAAKPGELRCYAHIKRRERGISGAVPIREQLTPFQRLVEACIALADAETESEHGFTRAKDRTRKAAEGWMRALGWRPPDGKRR